MGMTYGKAISTLESETQEAVEASVMLEAIDKILSMKTINAVNKDALLNAVRFLRNHVNELLKERQWISVKDRLPDKSGSYLILSDKGCANVLSYSVRHKAFNAFDLFEDARYALLCTHWMPLPEPPKEGDGE